MPNISFSFSGSGKFTLGKISATNIASKTIPAGEIIEAVRQHVTKDYSREADIESRNNAFSLQQGGAIVSSHTSSTGVKFLVVTEEDRKNTTISLADE